MRNICVLAPWEARAWRLEGLKPECKGHLHISKGEACQRTGHGDHRPYFTPIAEWVGPKQILMKADAEWRIVNQTIRGLAPGMPELQLVPGANALLSQQRISSKRWKPRGIPALRARRGAKYRRISAFGL